MAVATSVVVGILLVLLGKYLMLAFGVHKNVLEMGVRGLQFLAMFYVFMSLQNVLAAPSEEREMR
jgi:Na+-driven multidrug efflux pump